MYDFPFCSRWIPYALTLTCCALLGALPIAAANFTVTLPDDPTPDGCELNGCSLREAIIAANASPNGETVDTITLPAGTYTLEISGAGEDEAATGDLDITESLTINGAGAATTIVQAVADLDRIFHVLDPDVVGAAVTLAGLTVRNGYVLNDNGGGILVEAAEGGGPPPDPLTDAVEAEEGGVSLTLLGCEVRENVADSNALDPDDKPIGGSGGGIFAEAELTIEDTNLVLNTAAANGGGFYGGAPVTLSRSAINDNQAEGGGGIFLTGSSTSTMENCAILRNTATGGGGVTTRPMVTLTLRNCTVHANHATDVGAGVQTNGAVALYNSTVTDNTSDTDAPFGGAGLNSFGSGQFYLVNTVVAHNQSGLGEEALALLYAKVEPPAEPQIRNCGCTGGVCTSGLQFVSGNHNLEDADTCQLTGAEDQINTDPDLLALAWYGGPTETRMPSLTSPLVEAGDDATCTTVDQRGLARPFDCDRDGTAICDIGAVEADLLLIDGFESGDWGAWALSAP